MPEFLDKRMLVMLGNCIRVLNTEKTAHPDKLSDEPDVFYCIQVENNSGAEEVEYPILIPEDEFNKLEPVFPEGDKFLKMKPGRIYFENDNGKNFYCIKLRTPDECFVVMFPIATFKRYYELAQSHPSCCTKKNWFVNLFD